MTVLMLAAIAALLAVNVRQCYVDPTYTDDVLDVSNDVMEVE